MMSFILNTILDCLTIKIKKVLDKKEKDELFMLILNTNKKAARARSKNKNTELRRIKNRAKKVLACTLHGRTTWTLNEVKQVINLLAILKEDKRGVFYINENITNTLVKKF